MATSIYKPYPIEQYFLLQ